MELSLHMRFRKSAGIFVCTAFKLDLMRSDYASSGRAGCINGRIKTSTVC